MHWFALVRAAVVHGACECLEWTDGKDAFLKKDANGLSIEVRPQGPDGAVYLYDANYGNLGCRGERPAGRAELLAKKRAYWARAKCRKSFGKPPRLRHRPAHVGRVFRL